MEIQALKIFNSIKLILCLILVLGVITVLTACGDLVEESDANACNSAIDARDYGTAKSICTDRKDKASAYMGLAGYDIINLLKSKINLEHFSFVRPISNLITGFCCVNCILNVEETNKYEGIQLKSIGKISLIESGTNCKCACS